jgi:hypothetical protein
MRTAKKGLEYFPMGTDLFSDMKVRKLIKRQGGKSVTVYTCLLCNIYKEGYYIKWDNESLYHIGEFTSMEEAYIQEVLNACLSLELFSKELFESKKILTSAGIQKRYADICRLTKKRAGVEEYDLITSLTKPQNTETLNKTSETNLETSEVMQQRKGKENKEKESKGKEVTSEIFGQKIIYNSEEILQKLKSNFQWVEKCCRLFGLSVEEVEERLNKFILEQDTKTALSRSLKELTEHFVSWVKKPENQVKKNRNEGKFNASFSKEPTAL